MPYIQRNAQGEITGSFNQYQEGIAEEYLSQEDYESQRQVEPVVFSNKSPSRLFLDQIGSTPVWSKVYASAKQSTAVQAGMTLLLLSITAEFDLMFFIQSFRDTVYTIQNSENLPKLTEEDISTLRLTLEGNGFNSTLFLD